jgi:hypothetical protein
MAQLDSDKMFGQLLAQREAKQAAIEQPAPAEAPARRARQQVEGSKRSSWKMRAWYVQPETASRLRAYVNRQQENGTSIDASEVVDQALTAWLDQHAA